MKNENKGQDNAFSKWGAGWYSPVGESGFKRKCHSKKKAMKKENKIESFSLARKSKLSEDELEELRQMRTVPNEEDIELLKDKPRMVETLKGVYHPYMLEEVFKLAQFGMGNDEIADFYGITRQTFQKYLRTYPELELKLHEGRLNNGMKLVDSLYKQAFGYEVLEVSKEYVYNADGVEKLLSKKVTKKHIAPDAKVAMFLLRTRFPNLWMEDGGHGSGGQGGAKNNINIFNLDLRDLSDEELRLMKKMGFGGKIEDIKGEIL